MEDIDERSAVVKLLDPTYVPEPGTRAEARIPRSRLRPAEEEEEDPEGGVLPPDPPADGAGEEIIQEELGQGEEREEQGDWENEDEDDDDYGKWERGDDAPSNPSWICYIVAVK